MTNLPLQNSRKVTIAKKPLPRATLGAVLLPALLCACAPAPLGTPPAPASVAASAPASAAPAAPAAARPRTPAPASAAPAAARQLLRIDPQNSLIAVTVRRGGLLARMGHDHVVASRSIEGQAVAPAGGQPGHTDFRFRLDQLTVDESALRAEAGMTSVPAADAIAGTRNNMLNKVLEAEKYPYVQVNAVSTPEGPLQAAITLHGVTRRYAIPAVLTPRANGISAAGTLRLKQTDFGIQPYSVLGGALAVQDELELRFRIEAVAN
ncbi:YceI family protein [Massilia sp. FT127W]|uniref:YceI family protein n=1 Tax=Pseudoduganella aquatica TaxID=2660641 RepID=A0A7X4H8Q0_9BURK|nr:YceI family protein [Pseudoduganella aquatica]